MNEARVMPCACMCIYKSTKFRFRVIHVMHSMCVCAIMSAQST